MQANRFWKCLTILWVLLPFAVFADADTDQVSENLARQLPGVKPDQISLSPVPGIYEVIIGGDVLYITPDARFAFTGQLVDVASRTNLTEPALATARLKVLEQVPESEMIIYEPEGEVTHTITTFTDIDCPYCRKMHKEMRVLNDQGIRVRYLLFPRAGIDSQSYQKAVSVWCSDDRNQALTDAKAGQDPVSRQCDNPVKQQMQVAERLGLTGTPMTITDSGEKIGGYLPATELAKRLDQQQQQPL